MVRKIHRIWVQGEASLEAKEPVYHYYGKLWKSFFPNYTVKLWSEEDYLPLIEKFSKKLYEIYKTVPSYACKSDIARYIILYYEGGLYVDTDTEPLKNYSYLLEDNKMDLGLVRLNLNKSKLMFAGYEYSNSWIYAKKESPFLYRLLLNISLTKFNPDKIDITHYTWNVTGPGALSKSVKFYEMEKDPKVRIFSHSVIEITSFANSSEAELSSQELVKLYPFALNVHRMRASWVPGAAFFKLLGKLYTLYNNWSDVFILLSLYFNVYLLYTLSWR